MKVDDSLMKGFLSNDIGGSGGIGGGTEIGAPKQGNIGDTFSQMLKDSVKKVNEDQIVADSMSENLVSGKSQNIHETMIALEKADVSFKLMMQVRNKLVEGLQEIMRTPV